MRPVSACRVLSVVVVVAAASVLPSCSAPEREEGSELVLLFVTDMNSPKGFDGMLVDISAETESDWTDSFPFPRSGLFLACMYIISENG
jgi:hypothetical protein